MRLARTGDTELALALLVLAALAALVIALARHLERPENPAPRRGEPGMRLRSAAARLRPYHRTTTGTPAAPATVRTDPAAQVVDEVARRVEASQARLAGRAVPRIDPTRRHGRTL